MTFVSPELLALFSLIILTSVILFVRIPVALLLGIVGFCGYALLDGIDNAINMAGSELWGTFSGYGLTVVPLFILMGQVCYHSGLSERLYTAVYALNGHRRGGIATATLLTCGAFAAICGSNIATAATMSAVALPQMHKYGYHPVLATGAVAAGTTLGVIIPPSVVAIVVGVQTASSIQRLFLGGIIPGILLLTGFVITVSFLAKRHLDWAPCGERSNWKARLYLSSGLLEAGTLFLLILWGMTKGIFTPTEAGAAGSALAILFGLMRGKLHYQGICKALRESLAISAMIFMLMAGAAMFGKFLTLTRLPFTLADSIAAQDISPLLILLLTGIIFWVGGMIMDALALLVITIPIFFPLAEKLGWDPLWFSVLLIIITSIGAITPPVGASTFVVSSMSTYGYGKIIPVAQVFRGASYFLPSFLLCIILLVLFPSLITWLPTTLMGE